MLEKNESLSEKFIKKGFWLYLFSFVVGPVWYIIKIILSHDLSVEEIWILYWIISLISLLTVYHDLWLTEALNFFLPKYIVENNYSKFKSALAYAILAQIPTSLFIWGLLYFTSDYLAVNYFHAKELIAETQYVLKVFCLFFIWMNLFQIVNTVFWATQNTKFQKWSEFIRMIAILIFTLFFWYSGVWTLQNYSWTWIFGLIFWIIFSYILFYYKYYKTYLKWVKVIYDKVLFKEIFSYALWVLLAANVWMILSQVDMQLIIYLLGPRDAWFYTNYLSIIWIPFLIITPIIWFLFPVISELNSHNNLEKIKIIKSIFYKYFGVIALAVSGIMFVFSEQIAYILFWNKFIYSWTILKYSIFFLIFNFLLQINFQILAWIWRIKDRVKILWIWLIFFNIPLNLILIKLMWVSGSSLAVWLSWIPVFYLSNKALKSYHADFDYKFLIKNFIAVVVLNLLIKEFILPYFWFTSRLNSLLFILLIWFFYIITIMVYNQREFKIFLKEIKKILKK